MMRTNTTTRRRRLACTATIAAGLASVALALAPQAQAMHPMACRMDRPICDEDVPHTQYTERAIYASDEPGYVGWVTLKAGEDDEIQTCSGTIQPAGTNGGGNIAPVIESAPEVCPVTRVHVWQFTGAGWRRTTLPENIRGYRYPFRGGWSWLWTRAKGWVAARDTQLLIRIEKVSCSDSNLCPLPMIDALG